MIVTSRTNDSHRGIDRRDLEDLKEDLKMDITTGQVLLHYIQADLAEIIDRLGRIDRLKAEEV